jgi:hypothetical protein
MVVERANGGRLIDEAGRASYCSSDSTLAIVVVADRWSAAVALRSLWPPNAGYSVGAERGSLGSAALALRPLLTRDSVGAAFLGQSGLVTVRGSAPLAGGFTALVRTELGDSMRVVGTFTGLTVRQNGCMADAALPIRATP